MRVTCGEPAAAVVVALLCGGAYVDALAGTDRRVRVKDHDTDLRTFRDVARVACLGRRDPVQPRWVASFALSAWSGPLSEQQRVGGEWSAVETQRHAVFVHDSWFRRCCPGSTEPFTAIGLASGFVADQHEQGLDRAAAPSLDEVLAVRDVQGAQLGRWLSTVTADELSPQCREARVGRRMPEESRCLYAVRGGR